VFIQFHVSFYIIYHRPYITFLHCLDTKPLSLTHHIIYFIIIYFIYLFIT